MSCKLEKEYVEVLYKYFLNIKYNSLLFDVPPSNNNDLAPSNSYSNKLYKTRSTDKFTLDQHEVSNLLDFLDTAFSFLYSKNKRNNKSLFTLKDYYLYSIIDFFEKYDFKFQLNEKENTIFTYLNQYANDICDQEREGGILG